MAFKTDKQRKGFFANLQSKWSQHKAEAQKKADEKYKHEVKELEHEVKHEQVLSAQAQKKERLIQQKEAVIAQKRETLENLKAENARLKKERFERSRFGKVWSGTKKGAGKAAAGGAYVVKRTGRGLARGGKSFVEYERKHGKSQFAFVKKGFRKLTK